MFILLFLFWILLNGRVTAEIAVFGLFICVSVYLFLCCFMNYQIRYDLLVFRNLPWAFRYGATLVREVVKANLVMVQYIFSHRDIAEPALVTFSVPLKTSFARAVLANSITLTPGTITVSMVDGIYRVHCFDKSMAEGITDSVFVRLLLEMEASL